MKHDELTEALLNDIYNEAEEKGSDAGLTPLRLYVGAVGFLVANISTMVLAVAAIFVFLKYDAVAATNSALDTALRTGVVVTPIVLVLMKSVNGLGQCLSFVKYWMDMDSTEGSIGQTLTMEFESLGFAVLRYELLIDRIRSGVTGLSVADESDDRSLIINGYDQTAIVTLDRGWKAVCGERELIAGMGTSVDLFSNQLDIFLQTISEIEAMETSQTEGEADVDL